uniref:STAM-binding protein-like A n=2 Tax=Hirondellea gigas TaxID=1518452 RepID=A0A6A7G968_9CRUS
MVEAYLKELNQLASQPIQPVQHSIPLHLYFRMLDNLHTEAKSYLKDDDQVRGYVFLQRYCLSFINIVSKHNAISQKVYQSDRQRHKKQARHFLDYLEKLKPLVQENYEARVMAALTLSDSDSEEESTEQKIEPSEGKSDSEEQTNPTSGSTRQWDILRMPKPKDKGTTSSKPKPDKNLPVLGIRQVNVPTSLIATFLDYARPNTTRDIETCAILTGILKQNQFHVTTVIIPQQIGTANTCVTQHEEELIDIQIRDDLLTLGWIHTHPTQTCFLSSVDLHTQFSYQIMCVEAIAIVCAPTAKPDCGVFSLCDPHGVTVIKNCDVRGFHEHREQGVYSGSAHCIFDTVGSCKFIDLRK